MAQLETTSVYFIAKDDQHREAQLQITAYDSRDRLKRALTRLSLCWLLALISTPIVIAHFVLVPAFLVAGPWLGWRAYRQASQFNHASGLCPSCQKEARIKLEADDTLPKWTYCPNCNAPLQIAAQLTAS